MPPKLLSFVMYFGSFYRITFKLLKVCWYSNQKIQTVRLDSVKRDDEDKSQGNQVGPEVTGWLLGPRLKLTIGLCGLWFSFTVQVRHVNWTVILTADFKYTLARDRGKKNYLCWIHSVQNRLVNSRQSSWSETFWVTL